VFHLGSGTGPTLRSYYVGNIKGTGFSFFIEIGKVEVGITYPKLSVTFLTL